MDDPGSRQFVVRGDTLDCASAPRAIAEVERAALAAGATSVTLNLSRIEFIDSSGISAILGLHHRLRVNGGAVCLVAARHRVRRVFVITKLTQLLG